MVKNSERVWALVVYTGAQTKLLLNLGKYQFKFSQNDIRYNQINLFMLCLMLFVAGMLTLGNNSFNKGYYDVYGYIFEGDEDVKSQLTGLSFLSFYLILNMFLPLDLVVAIELAKLFYTPFIEADAFMKEPDYSTGSIIGCSAQSITLHEELGEIDYVFSDKTGTIT
eukprot:CAMPEP_0116871888 /NCGR_PEP_ID=MMETSP0463-20121206/2429_1 /TAXON_ID=181622 /ORGANISM="Strombidinopsis sp, Strain SopsisLIS2011" /LENGTH=166 /DNA_ID=CAMNT_0004511141 /DNA_START=861 /DNA_END=1361 /DNA_ORIENTATION=+